MKKLVTNKHNAFILYDRNTKRYYANYYGGIIDFIFVDNLEKASQLGYEEALEIKKDMVCYNLEILKIEVKTTIKII